MAYNIHYDVSAILVYIFTLYCILSIKGIRKVQNKVFFAIIMNGLLSAILDILSVTAIYSIQKHSYLMTNIYNYLYLFIHNIMPILFCIYVLMVLGVFHKKSKQFFYFLMIPFIFTFFVLILNPVFNWVFYYNEELEYFYGPMRNGIFLSAFIYIGISIFYIIRYRKSISSNKIAAMFLFVLSGAISLGIRYFYPALLIELFVESLAFLGILFTVENKDEIFNGITGVYNRRAFLTENIVSMKSKMQYSVITIKFLNLKYYNSVLGVVFMNQVMREIALWLNEITDRGEVYDCENGEFSIVLHKYTPEQVMGIGDILYQCFSKDWIYQNINIAFNTQICLIRIPTDVDTLEKLLIMVDTDYGSSDNKVSFIYGERLKFLHRELEVEKAIQRALDKQSFQVFYQPIWDSRVNKIRSAEALIRLLDEEMGFIPPDEFIPISEKNGTIVEIGEFVLKEVCRLLRDTNIRQLGVEFIEINLSTVQCMHKDLASRFQEILDKYGISASSINLEITESATVDSPKMLLPTMNQLKKLGFTFSMDDYGTGYSNFSYMFNWDFDNIKLDKSILWSAERSQNGKIILKNTIRMLKELELNIVIEGVETEEQKNYVTSLGCDYCQGYYFSRPIDVVSFLEYCEDFNKGFS